MADTIYRLQFSPKINPSLNTDTQKLDDTKNWNAIEHFAEPDNEQNMDINYAFANCSDEEEISLNNL